MQGTEIQTDGMVDKLFWVTSDRGKQMSITIQAFVTNVPTIIIVVGKLLMGKTKLTFNPDAHMFGASTS